MLDKINNKNITKLLPGIKLGLDIRDECWDSSIALEETIDFIKDTIALDDQNELMELNYPNQTLYTNDTFSKQSISNLMCLNNNNNNNNYYYYNNVNGNYLTVQKEKTKIMAVIGPAGSSVAINVQNLLQLFDVTQIGYSATSRDLSDKKMFKTFLRVVPNDYLQVKAIADVVVKMNWTYIFAIYTDGSYGQAGMEAFRNETNYLNICIASYEKIRAYASMEDYEIIIKKMNQTTSNANVIVCFCYGETVRGLLGAINKLGLKGRFLILGR
jgi:metabotropic glutamate receptor 1